MPAHSLHTCTFYNTPYTNCTPHEAVGVSRIEMSIEMNLKLLANTTLFLYGDSIQRQIFREIVCRLGPIKSKKPAMRKKLRNRWDECYEFKLNTLILCFSSSGALNDNHPDREVLSKIASLQPNVALVANFGVHYNLDTPGDFSKLTDRCLRFSQSASSFGLSKTILWRQTLAQHFNTQHGTFSPKLGRGLCREVNNKTFIGASWRNSVCDPLFLRSSISIVETFEDSFYAPANLHVGNGDCTHFCQPGYLIHPVATILKEVVAMM